MRACEGVVKPRICRVRPLRSAATRSRSTWLHRPKIRGPTAERWGMGHLSADGAV